VAAETTREPRGTSCTFLDVRVDAIVHQTHRLRTLKSSLDEVADLHVNALVDRLTASARARD
jgi:hypothetical protein